MSIFFKNDNFTILLILSKITSLLNPQIYIKIWWIKKSCDFTTINAEKKRPKFHQRHNFKMKKSKFFLKCAVFFIYVASFTYEIETLEQSCDYLKFAILQYKKIVRIVLCLLFWKVLRESTRFRLQQSRGRYFQTDRF